MSKPVINIDDLEFKPVGKGEKFQAERAQVSPLIGGRDLGYSVMHLKPGKRAWPYHAHLAIEEMFYIISGSGTLRHAGEEYPIQTGDFICSPADANQPHQIVNTSAEDLLYIALSTDLKTDVVVYPESGKYGVWHGDSNDLQSPDNFRVFARKESGVDYWDGEDTDD